jgi:uncharacterized membrane protein
VSITSDRTTFSSLEPHRADRAGVVLQLASLCIGLFAGLLFSFAVAVMPALRKADDRTFVVVMQRINVAIQNPLFGFTFMGGIGFTLAAAVLHRRLGATEATRWIVAALCLYLVALAITGGINIPLNDKIAKANLDSADFHALRRSFENPWTVAHDIRTVFATLSMACLGRAMVLSGRETSGHRA